MSKSYIISTLRKYYRKIFPLKIRNLVWQHIIKYFLGGRIFYFPDYPKNIKNTLKKQIYLKTNFLKDYRYNYYAGDEKIVTTIKTGQIIVVRRDDNSTAPYLILKGDWEPYITYYSERFVEIYRSPTIFDVGAHFGWYGLTLSRLSDESLIHYFEANNSLIDCIKRTTIINGLEHRSKINHNAVSDINGEILKLNILNHLQGSSSIEDIKMDLTDQTSTFFGNIKEPNSIDVESITIDEYSNKHAIKNIDFLKIDVEGHEENVIEGAKRMLAESKDITLLIEWNRNRYSDNMLKKFAGFEVLILIDGKKAINCKGLHKSCNSTDEFENKLNLISNLKYAHFDLIFTSKKMLNLSNIKTKFIPSF